VNRDDVALPEHVLREIEDCHNVLVDVLSWLFDATVRVHTSEHSTDMHEAEEGTVHPDDPMARHKYADPETKFKIVAKMPRASILGFIMKRLTVEQKAELSAYLMLKEDMRKDSE
jgi:hypothetical protein